MADTYIVAEGRIALHSKNGKHYYEGQTIDLSHLSKEQIDELLAIGLVVKKTDKKEVKNG